MDLTEADLKDEFQITILGHRKTLQSGIQQLSTIYTKGKNSSYVKEKIQKYYEGKNKIKNIRPMKNLSSFEGRFNSLRKFHSSVYNSKHEVIEEKNDETEIYSMTPERQPKTPDKDQNSSNHSNFKLDSKESDKERRNSNSKNESRRDNKRGNRGSFASGSSVESGGRKRAPNKKNRKQPHAEHSYSDDDNEYKKRLSDYSQESKERKGGKENHEGERLHLDLNFKENNTEQSATLNGTKNRSPGWYGGDGKEGQEINTAETKETRENKDNITIVPNPRNHLSSSEVTMSHHHQIQTRVQVAMRKISWVLRVL